MLKSLCDGFLLGVTLAGIFAGFISMGFALMIVTSAFWQLIKIAKALGLLLIGK